ncbi:DUF3141 domain-containing protein [Aureimonas altamirensis]|uniref:DUF3141 domain-containing protein n=1 Tax=Aureimonas altamirensis TaxID=370622 RepID=UPI0012E06F69|nr:DUF3141 domain-containing protein [Aureimonas altamirensis]
MSQTATPGPQWSDLWQNPFALARSAAEYGVDAGQRAVLYVDIERRVGDQYREELKGSVLNVLDFEYEIVMSGLELARPTNYALHRILPKAGEAVDETRRPFIVIDPRAGHGPGIGGFKPESEIGAALKAGHPCYWVGFHPDPVPGQTVEDVVRTFAAFAERVAALHPESPGRPAAIGNCQAGWQLLMSAALWPELFGPLIVAGAPLSYWAGENPMRYAGGLLGGSWLTALTSDLGAGRFDGAWLVQNFENLDPANTLWSKQYNVYANADTEAERYLGFEKYWGGYVFLNDVEMQYIVDNLFIGNKLSTAQLLTSDGLRIDLRNIRSPIVVFCSHGDNITPPPQALGWITDLYEDDEDVVSHDQTILYSTHASVGHLGIFVSSSVGEREHRKFASMIDQIDLFPAGIYRASVEATPETADFPDRYLMSIARSNVDEVREIVRPAPRSDQKFAAAARVSEINLALYRNMLQPWVRAFSTPYAAQWLQALHPLRAAFEFWSSANPATQAVGQLAGAVREHRSPASSDNLFRKAEEEYSKAVEHFLDRYREHRDGIYAASFDLLYGSPWLKALAGQLLDDESPARPHPGESREHRQTVRETLARLDARLYEGGLEAAALRALFHVMRHRGSVDERHYFYASRLLGDADVPRGDPNAFRHIIREQALLLRRKGDAAIDAIIRLLRDEDPERIERAAGIVSSLARAGRDTIPPEAEQALARVLGLFEEAASANKPTAALPSPAIVEPHTADREETVQGEASGERPEALEAGDVEAAPAPPEAEAALPLPPSPATAASEPPTQAETPEPAPSPPKKVRRPQPRRRRPNG